MQQVYDEHLIEEDNKIWEIWSMIEMKSQAKANKSAFEKNLEQWTYFN